jgi:hypothetical protein
MSALKSGIVDIGPLYWTIESCQGPIQGIWFTGEVIWGGIDNEGNNDNQV